MHARVATLLSQDLPCEVKSARRAVEEAAGAFEFRKTLFFFAELARMRNECAAGSARGVLHVQHLVIQNILHDALRHAWMIEPAVEQNLIRARVITTELPPPGPRTPSDMRLLQLSREELSIQFFEHFFQIEMSPTRLGGRQANALAAHAVHATARAAGSRVFEVRFDERRGRSATIHARKQQSRCSFQHRKRRAAQEVGESHEDELLAPPDG